MVNQISSNQFSQYAGPVQLGSLGSMPNVSVFPNRLPNINPMKDLLCRPQPYPMQGMMNNMMRMMERMMSMLGNLINGLLSKLGMGDDQASIMPVNGSQNGLGGLGGLFGGSSSTGQSSGGIFGGLLNNLGGIGNLIGSIFGGSKDSEGKSGGFLGGIGSFLKNGIGSWLGKIF